MRATWLLAFLLLGCNRVTPVEEISVGTASSAQIAEFMPADEDWTSWRGPHRNGVSDSITAATVWSETQNVVWKSQVPGRGHSSPTVHGNQVILATAIKADQQQMVVAFDRDSGTENWRTVLHTGGFPSDKQMHPKGTHANGTVACDDQSIFIAFLNNDQITASAVDFQGKIVWQTTLGAFNSRFGYAPSPVLHKSFVIFACDNQGGGYLAAVHRRTGDIVWRRARSNYSSYSSPVVARIGGRDQLLISGGREVSSYNPDTGELLWSCEGTTDATCGTMVWNDSMVFASGGYPGKQTLAVRADGSGEVAWSNSVQNYEPSMLLVDDALYATTDGGVAYCWNAATGDLHWRKRLGGSFSSSPTYCAGRIYASNTSGTTFVFDASPEQFRLVAKNRLGNDAYATPTICGGRIFMRVGTSNSGVRQETLYCLGENATP